MCVLLCLVCEVWGDFVFKYFWPYLIGLVLGDDSFYQGLLSNAVLLRGVACKETVKSLKHQKSSRLT